jgi:phage-related protein
VRTVFPYERRQPVVADPSNRKAYETSVAAIERLAQFGHELRRPSVDFLTGGVYELRIRRGRVNYRILYFFHGRNLAI